MGCYSPCRDMYLELRNRPMSREHTRPQPPAASRRHGGGAEEPAPVRVTGHRTQRPRGQVGPPGPHPAQPSSSRNPGGERRPIPPPLAPLIAQLVDLHIEGLQQLRRTFLHFTPLDMHRSVVDYGDRRGVGGWGTGGGGGGPGGGGQDSARSSAVRSSGGGCGVDCRWWRCPMAAVASSLQRQRLAEAGVVPARGLPGLQLLPPAARCAGRTKAPPIAAAALVLYTPGVAGAPMPARS
jgi:hypothetical protein